MRMIFINLPVEDVETARTFYAALGFTLNPMFSDERTASMVIEENIVVMLLRRDRFQDFVTGAISDARQSTEVLNCLSAQSREEVDEMLAKALASGGKPWQPVMDQGPMYGASFQDPDGHVWEVMHMDLPAVQG
jgi:hypothetical protein